MICWIVSIKFGILKTTGVMLLTKHVYRKEGFKFWHKNCVASSKDGKMKAKCMPRVPTSFWHESTIHIPEFYRSVSNFPLSSPLNRGIGIIIDSSQFYLSSKNHVETTLFQNHWQINSESQAIEIPNLRSSELISHTPKHISKHAQQSNIAVKSKAKLQESLTEKQRVSQILYIQTKCYFSKHHSTNPILIIPTFQPSWPLALHNAFRDQKSLAFCISVS